LHEYDRQKRRKTFNSINFLSSREGEARERQKKSGMSYAASTYLLARLLSAYIAFHFLTMSLMNYPLRHFSEFFVLVCFVIISSFVLIFPFAHHFIDNEFASSFVVLY